MGVEMYEANVAYFGSNFVLPDIGHSFEQAYGQTMLGTSIGPAGNRQESGSLGFYLKVEHGGDEEIMAITCHHVVAPGTYLSQPKPSPFRLANSLGLAGKDAPIRPVDPPITMQSPSYGDHLAWTAKLDKAIQNSADIHGFFTAMTGQEYSEEENENSLRLQTARTLLRDIGLVRISSGMLNVVNNGHDECRLDWALIGLTGSRFAAGLEDLNNVSTSVARAAAQ